MPRHGGVRANRSVNAPAASHAAAARQGLRPVATPISYWDKAASAPQHGSKTASVRVSCGATTACGLQHPDPDHLGTYGNCGHCVNTSLPVPCPGRASGSARNTMLWSDARQSRDSRPQSAYALYDGGVKKLDSLFAAPTAACHCLARLSTLLMPLIAGILATSRQLWDNSMNLPGSWPAPAIAATVTYCASGCGLSASTPNDDHIARTHRSRDSSDHQDYGESRVLHGAASEM